VQPPASLADIDRKLASAAPSAQAAASAAPREVLTTLEQWRAAWSARDVDRYLSMYAPTFKPSGGLTRAKWEQQRRERIGRASFVVVKVVDPQVTVAGSDAAAIFTQVYESDTLKESGRKKLALVLVGDGKWRIREETFEK
jgi:ketosteroid isomerase-like protein